MKKFYDIVVCIRDIGSILTKNVFVMDTDLNPKENDLVEYGHELYTVDAVRQSEYLDPEFLDFLVHNGSISGTAEIIYHRQIKEDKE